METVDGFEVNLKENIEIIHHEVKTDTYSPSELRRVYIDKPNGEKKPLEIPIVKDRGGTTGPFEYTTTNIRPRFHLSSYGYRLNRSCQKIVITSILQQKNFKKGVDNNIYML